MELHTVLMVVAPEGFQDFEYSIPRELFDKKGIRVTVASKGVKEAVGSLGKRIKVDIDISHVDPFNFDAVIFVGGPGAGVFFDDAAAHYLARHAGIVGGPKVLAAICIAPVILARAGVLKGKKATVFPSGADDLRKAGAVCTAQDVVVDGNTITANGPKAAKAFADEILKKLS